MSPPDFVVGVLRIAVLGVVNDEVRPFQERDVALVAGMAKGLVRRFPERLMVGHVRHRRVAAGDAVRESRRGVVQVLRLNEHVADTEKPFFQLRKVDAAAQVAESDGKVGMLHLPCNRVLDAALKARRRIDV